MITVLVGTPSKEEFHENRSVHVHASFMNRYGSLEWSIYEEDLKTDKDCKDLRGVSLGDSFDSMYKLVAGREIYHFVVCSQKVPTIRLPKQKLKTKLPNWMKRCRTEKNERGEY